MEADIKRINSAWRLGVQHSMMSWHHGVNPLSHLPSTKSEWLTDWLTWKIWESKGPYTPGLMHNDLKFAAIGVVPGGQLDVTTYRPVQQKTKERVKEEWQEWNEGRFFLNPIQNKLHQSWTLILLGKLFTKDVPLDLWGWFPSSDGTILTTRCQTKAEKSTSFSAVAGFRWWKAEGCGTKRAYEWNVQVV